MSLTNFDEIFLICCDWKTVLIRNEAIKFEKGKSLKDLDLIPLITDYSWESGVTENLSDQENRKVTVFL